MPRLTVKRLSDAALSFAHGTSYTYDGFHPRHYALLQYKTLLAITMLYEAIECMGVMPTESQHAMIALLPKPKGGFRPIALLPGVCRLHGKARKPDIDQWEAANAREYLACSKGRGALDAVWKRSILAEYAVNSHTCALALLWDLKSFFDTIDLDLLRERAQQVNFPAVLVNLAIATYKTPRYVHTRQGVAEPVYPGRGVLPGCSFAKALIGVYYMPVMDEFCKRHPYISVSIYIDDITLSINAFKDEIAEELLLAAAIDMRDLIYNELLGAIAVDKAAVVSSSQTLAESFRAKLGPLAGAPTCTTPDLGVDFAAGRKRGRNGVVRKTRIRTAAKKKKNLLPSKG